MVKIAVALLSLVKDKEMATEKHEDVSDAPLSPHEARRVRLIIRDNDYSKRFWSEARLWASYVAAVTIFLLTFWEKVKIYVIHYLPWGS